MRQELSDKIKGLAKWTAGVAIGAAVIVNLSDGNGMLDSMRTKEAQRYHNSKHQTKKVTDVQESWRDTLILSPTMDGYNPQVTREVTFDDGSRTTLKYRTLAWQPFVRWINGEEFNPKPGETYEVAAGNRLVRKIG